MPAFAWLYAIAFLAFILAVTGKSKGFYFTICAFGIVLGVVLQMNPQR